jgi:ribosomal protein S18 acetylase RimI-like enzyme
MLEIRQASTSEDYEFVAQFYRAFGQWLRQTYPELIPIADSFFATIDNEIRNMPGIYAPPGGCLLLAYLESIPVGTVGLAAIDGQTCEMRRMFVDARYRGEKVGRSLADRLLEQARTNGFRQMQLETLPRHYAALGLYRSLGFEEVKSVDGQALPEDLPEDLQRGTITMELTL